MNYTVCQLNSNEASKKYKIKDLSEIKFDPKFIMKKVVELYLNFQVYDIFLDSVVKDKRSFLPEVFERTADLLENNNVVESHLVADFRTLLKKIYNM